MLMDQRLARSINTPNTFDHVKVSGGVKYATCRNAKSVYWERAYTDRLERSWAGAQVSWSTVQTIVVSHM